jgi:pyruvate dehydrogenase (quinone)
MNGSPKFEESQVLPDVSYADFARSIGLTGIAVERDEDIGPAWDAAFAAGGPVVLDVRCDPNVPPIPPHATLEQVKSVTEAVLKGDPDAWRMVTTGIRTKAQELLPHKK